MVEAVRLVIWDLDETFWRGTLSEEGITQYVQEHHDIVVALAHRGIISSICSKNDRAAVQSILTDHGIWEYFIFPSIDWTSKAARIESIIDAVQLRAPTVMFIDDNPLNRREVKARIPDIQVESELFIAGMLGDPRFIGKDDRGQTRLEQYKLLEKRKADELSSGSDNDAFLKSCDIRVSIEYDVERHIDRAVELINRTNQLNFTKKRLPSDPVEAARELRADLNVYSHQVGLVRVQDNYGDYGFVGFFMLKSVGKVHSLIHYCFSCRTLGMGVEKWFYDKLGSPGIEIQGEVLTDLKAARTIDWIEWDLQQDVGRDGDGKLFRDVRLRGGCDLDALLHYFRKDADTSFSETNYLKFPLFVRRDTTTNLLLALDNPSNSVREALSRVEIGDDELSTGIFDEGCEDTLIILSAWADVYAPIYRHKALGFEYTICLNNLFFAHVTWMTPENMTQFLQDLNVPHDERPAYHRIHDQLRTEYDCVGVLDEDRIRANWEKIVKWLPPEAHLCVIHPSAHRYDEKSASQVALYKRAVEEVVGKHERIMVVDVTDHMTGLADTQDHFSDHLDRMVYFKLYQEIRSKWIDMRNRRTHAAM